MGVSGYDAIRSMCYAVYDYAIENPDVFEAMLWYHKNQDEASKVATGQLSVYYTRIMSSLNISKNDSIHLIRILRSFIEGFFLLVNKGAFGSSLPIKESFDMALEIMIEGMKSLEKREV